MPLQPGRAFLLQVGNGATPEVFTTVGAARLVDIVLDNQLTDATRMNGGGHHAVSAAAGVQALQVGIEGLFRDSDAEEALRAAAFGRTVNNYRLSFPNGDTYTAAFAVADYRRDGAVEGLESFAATLVRSGAGVFA